MPEMPDVIPNEPVEDEWGNKIRDRTLQRYTSISQRNALNPAPTPGEISYLGDTGVIEVYHSGLWRATVPTGVVFPYAGITPPTGYLICNGSLVSRTTYAGLFAVIGTTYGAGDGSTTFQLPDLRQRFPMGMASSGAGSALGDKGGAFNHTHSGPSHVHQANAHAHTVSGTTSTKALRTTGATKGTPGGHTFDGIADVPAQASEHDHGIPTHDHTFSDTSSSAGAVNTDAAGTGATGQANPPFIALHFVIRT
jgi:microcystin-dependent protein